jgi:nucleotide-binding universal stress UspA family protein
MKHLHKILVPTDLSEHSRCALTYGCWLAAEENAALVILHVADEFTAWEYYSEDLAFSGLNGKPWPVDRVLEEASLDLSPISRAEPVRFEKDRQCNQARRARFGGTANRRGRGK